MIFHDVSFRYPSARRPTNPKLEIRKQAERRQPHAQEEPGPGLGCSSGILGVGLGFGVSEFGLIAGCTPSGLGSSPFGTRLLLSSTRRAPSIARRRESPTPRCRMM